MHSKIQNEVDRFLQLGEHDPLYSVFDGANIIDRCKRGHQTLVDALKSKIASSERQVLARIPQDIPSDLRKFTRKKVEPMVRGLFKRAEQEKVLKLLDGCLHVLLPSTIEAIIDSEDLESQLEGCSPA